MGLRAWEPGGAGASPPTHPHAGGRSPPSPSLAGRQPLSLGGLQSILFSLSFSLFSIHGLKPEVGEELLAACSRFPCVRA